MMIPTRQMINTYKQKTKITSKKEEGVDQKEQKTKRKQLEIKY